MAYGLRIEVDLAETLVHGRLQGADAPVTVKLFDEHAFEPGTILAVDPAPGRLHVFDAESGKRI